MAGDAVSLIAALRKYVFDKEATEDVMKADEVLEKIWTKARPIEIGGISLNATLAIRNATGVTVGTLSEAGSFPTPGFQSGVSPTLTCSHFAAAVGWSGHVVAMGKDQLKSFQTKSVIQQNLQDLKDGMKKLLTRMIAWNGTAIWGTTAAASGTTGGYITLASGSAPINFFEPGWTLTLRTATSGGTEKLTNAATGAGRILQVRDDLDPPQIVLTDATGATAGGGDYVAVSGLYDTTVIDGLLNLVKNTGTVMGLDRATGANAAMRAYYKDMGGASLGLTDPDFLRDVVNDRASLRYGYASSWVCNRRTRRSLAASTLGMVRFSGPTDVNMGTPTMKVNDKDGTKEVQETTYIPDKYLFAVDYSKFVKGSPEGMEGPQMVDNPAGSPVFMVPGTSNWTDAYRSFATLRCAVGMEEFRASGVLTNFTPAT